MPSERRPTSSHSNCGLPLHTRYEETNTYRKTVLDNDLRVITEEVPHMKSVSMGIWVRCGSRFEQPALNGICHFIEHMLFKGTQRRSAFDIAREMDSVGGILNAFTSKELTAFYGKVLGEDLELAVDLLSDLFINSSFPEEEIDREKQVICQEINQLEDSPEELVHEILGNRLWQGSPLGQPVLGTIPTVLSIQRDSIINFKDGAYAPAETLVCAAGSVNHDRFVELIEKHMGSLPQGPARNSHPKPAVEPSSQVIARDLEQVHVCLGLEGPSAVDDKRHAGHILNTILGGGMSSRLFQEVREKKGLAYSIYSYLSSVSDTGIFAVYAGCDPGRVEELLTILKKETTDLAGSLTEEEIRTAKNQMRGNIVLSMESSDSRMHRLAKSEFYFGRYITVDEIIGALERVTPKKLAETARQLFGPGRCSLVALGPVDETDEIFRLFER
ncbi:MAG: M16 family metallopeptidase [Thermodesulfobacteriota bacterium]